MKPSQPQPPAVVKKSSPNGKLTIYLGKRDFISYKDYSENIDGIVLIDPNYLERIKKHKVLVSLYCNQRFGQEDKFSETSTKFENQLYSVTNQIYPNQDGTDNNGGVDAKFDQLTRSEYCITKSEQPVTTTQLQNHILQKLAGKSKYAFPFYFKLPKNSANSVSIQSAPGDKGKPLGVSYEIRVWILENSGETNRRTKSADNDMKNSTKLEGILPSTYELDNKDINDVSAAYSFGSIHPIGPKQQDSVGSSKNGQNGKNDLNVQNNQKHEIDNVYLTQKMTIDASCMQISGNVRNNNENVDKIKSSSGTDRKPSKTDIFSGNPLNREVNIVVRKFYHHLNTSPLPPPEVTVKESFLVGKDISLNISLDKSVYRHNEKIYVKIGINNQSGKEVKKIRATVVQYVDMCLSESSTIHKYTVDWLEEENINIDPNSGIYSDTFKMCPLLAKCKDLEGIAVDGKLKNEDTNLAGSIRQEQGVSVNYKIKVKVSVGGMVGDTVIAGEVPFDLCHFGKVGTPRVKQLQQGK